MNSFIIQLKTLLMLSRSDNAPNVANSLGDHTQIHTENGVARGLFELGHIIPRPMPKIILKREK